MCHPCPRTVLLPMSPTAQSRLFNQLIRSKEHGPRDCETQRLRGPQIDDDLEFGRLLDGQIGGLGALQDLVNVARGTTEIVTNVGAVAHEATDLRVCPVAVHCW